MNLHSLFRTSLFGCALAALIAPAFADSGALGFVKSEHMALSALLRQPPSGTRDRQMESELARMVDYDELARRSFGQPCPTALPSCTNHWAALSQAQQAEVTPLLRQLVVKNEKRNIEKTLDYDVDYKGERPAGELFLVHLEAKSKQSPRAAPLEIEYLVATGNGRFHVVDMVTEGSSRARNYYTQFNRMLTNPSQGYPYVVAKLKENIAKKSSPDMSKALSPDVQPTPASASP
jgi:ABC-type transporter MlaC component